MIEYKRNDENFNLDNITNQQLFDGLKDGIEESAKGLKQFSDSERINIEFEDNHSSRKQAYGTDGNIYPNVHLSTTISNPDKIYCSVNAIVVVTPFDGKMIVYGEGTTMQTLSPESLQTSLHNFMAETFPDSDYAEKLQKYQKASQIRTKVYDEMVFGK